MPRRVGSRHEGRPLGRREPRASESDDLLFRDSIAGLRAGDFSRLAPLFTPGSDGAPSRISRWLREGRFRGEDVTLAEAFSCACFDGFVSVAEELLNAVTEMLIARNLSMQTVSMHETTLLGTALWSQLNETKPDHARIIALLRAVGAT